MPAAEVWLAAERPNLVGSIFKKEGETEDMQRKTERFGYFQSEVQYVEQQTCMSSPLSQYISAYFDISASSLYRDDHPDILKINYPHFLSGN